MVGRLFLAVTSNYRALGPIMTTLSLCYFLLAFLLAQLHLATVTHGSIEEQSGGSVYTYESCSVVHEAKFVQPVQHAR